MNLTNLRDFIKPFVKKNKKEPLIRESIPKLSKNQQQKGLNFITLDDNEDFNKNVLVYEQPALVFFSNSSSINTDIPQFEHILNKTSGGFIVAVYYIDTKSSHYERAKKYYKLTDSLPQLRYYPHSKTHLDKIKSSIEISLN